MRGRRVKRIWLIKLGGMKGQGFRKDVRNRCFYVNVILPSSAERKEIHNMSLK